ESEGRIAGREKASDVLPHQVSHEAVGKDVLEGGTDLDPKLLRAHVVGEQNPMPVEIPSDAERACLTNREVIERPFADAIHAHEADVQDRKSTRLNSSHLGSSYAASCLKKKNSSPMTT